MVNNSKSLYNFLKSHQAKNAISFHMPGHKGSEFYKRFGYYDFFHDFLNMDITEIPGADNLFQQEGILKDCAEKYKHLYNSGKSYLLINGTSGGIIASILASVDRGGKLIMARNCHKSVFNALSLGGITPIYAYPTLLEEYHISGHIAVEEIERLLEKHPDAQAVILPSPNYYGVCSDVQAIVALIHKHGKTLIIDEAHGAHLHFLNKQASALDLGADMVVNSIHKTLSSMTQSALLNVSKDAVSSGRVDLDVLEDQLQVIQSTSPSYILMASLDITADILKTYGKELMEEWRQNLNYFYGRCSEIKNLSILKNNKQFTEEKDKYFLDETKMNFSFQSIGLSGLQLEEILIKNYNIYTELVAGDLVMAMSGIGNTRQHFVALSDALEDISREVSESSFNIDGHFIDKKPTAVFSQPLVLKDVPKVKYKVMLKDSVGGICATSLIPYPPGIPIACPGEVLTKELVDYILSLRQAGEKVMGVTADGEVFVGKDECTSLT